MGQRNRKQEQRGKNPPNSTFFMLNVRQRKREEERNPQAGKGDKAESQQFDKCGHQVRTGHSEGSAFGALSKNGFLRRRRVSINSWSHRKGGQRAGRGITQCNVCGAIHKTQGEWRVAEAGAQEISRDRICM